MLKDVASRKPYDKPALRKSLVLLQSVTAQNQSQATPVSG